MKVYLSSFFIFIGVFMISPVQSQNFYKDLTPRYRHLTVGFGPSVAYTDFSFEESYLPSRLLPSAFLSYSQQLRDHLFLVTTTGAQLSESNHVFRGVEDLAPFVDLDQSISNKTLSVFLDMMPQFNIWRSDNHVWRPRFQVYGGIGLGVILSHGAEQYITQINQEFLSDEDIERQTPRISRVTGYIPLRIGISKKIHPHWDLGLQGTYMYLFTDRFEGNNIINNRNDQLFQLHITLKRYLAPSFAPFICY